MIYPDSTIENASVLIEKALNPKNTSMRDAEYAALLRLYQEDMDFKAMVDDDAKGRKLEIYRANDYGMVLGLANAESNYALRLGSLNRHFQGEDTGLVLIAMLVVAVAFFPSAEALEDEEYGLGEFIRLDQLMSLLGQYIQDARKRNQSNNVMDRVEPMFTQCWRKLESLPPTLPGTSSDAKSRPNKGSHEGLLRHALAFYERSGFVQLVESEDSVRITATQRFRVQASVLFGHIIYNYFIELQNDTDV